VIARHRTRLPEKEEKRYIQFDRNNSKRKRGTVVEYLTVVPKIEGSRPSAAAFEIFQL
jgi:hypothetical protein